MNDRRHSGCRAASTFSNIVTYGQMKTIRRTAVAASASATGQDNQSSSAKMNGRTITTPITRSPTYSDQATALNQLLHLAHCRRICGALSMDMRRENRMPQCGQAARYFMKTPNKKYQT